MSTLVEVEAKLRAAMDARRAEGITIAPGLFIRREGGVIKACCAIGAVAIGAGDLDTLGCNTAATKALGISFDDGLIIAAGFDGTACSWDNPTLHDLGRRLRADYLGAP